MKAFFLTLVAVLNLPPSSTAEYSPRDFISQAPAEIFYTTDAMTENEKQGALRSYRQRSDIVECTAWGITEESPTALTLQRCPDSFIRIQLFRGVSGDTIVAVESNRSMGRSCDLTFFNMASGTRMISEITEIHLQNLGLELVTENDLLTEEMKFPSGTARRLMLSLDETGCLWAKLWHWMDPRWETRTPAFDIVFRWDGSRFQKLLVKRPLRPPL
jgi:hypothetical protein